MPESASAVVQPPAVAGHDALASSPTLDDHLLGPQSHERSTPSPGKVSSGSSSVGSDDFENMKRWPGFENNASFDDSGVDLEEEDEGHDQFPVGGRGSDEQDNDPWDSDDQYSSDIYSKRAEMILANAKKRLNVCLASFLLLKQADRANGIYLGHGREFARCPQVSCRFAHTQ